MKTLYTYRAVAADAGIAPFCFSVAFGPAQLHFPLISRLCACHIY